MSEPAKTTSSATEPRHLSFHTMPVEHMSDTIDRQFVYGQQGMLARILLKKGAIVPEHSHHNEQISYILSGALRFTSNGKQTVVRAGEVFITPPNVPHSAEALEDTENLDVFAPPRQDWIDGDDAYLRGK